MAVNQGIGDLVSSLPEERKSRTIASEHTTSEEHHPNTDSDHGSGVEDYKYVDLDTAYVADITDLIDPQQRHNYRGKYPKGIPVLLKVQYRTAGCQLRITDIDGRRVTASATNQIGDPTRLELLHHGRGRCEQRIRDSKDLGLGKLPFSRFTANQIWCHTVVLASSLLHWTGILGTDEEQLCRHQRQAHQWHRADRIIGKDVRGAPIKRRRPISREKFRLWEPKSWRVRIGSIAATVARHARSVMVRCGPAMAFTGVLIAAIGRMRSLGIP